MNNMRRGFTMIELVFVIVIIGILAAVALPRFTGISDDARMAKLTSFVGTLNRTTGPSVWSGLIRIEPAANGSVVAATAAKHNSIGIQAVLGADAQLDTIPSEFSGVNSLNLTNCDPAIPRPIIPNIGTAYAPVPPPLATSVMIGTTTYSLYCVDSTLNDSPTFYLMDDTTGLVAAK